MESTKLSPGIQSMPLATTLVPTVVFSLRMLRILTKSATSRRRLREVATAASPTGSRTRTGREVATCYSMQQPGAIMGGTAARPTNVRNADRRRRRGSFESSTIVRSKMRHLTARGRDGASPRERARPVPAVGSDGGE